MSSASINGVPIVAAGETIGDDERRQRACTELLRQAAQRAGLLAADDPAPQQGAISEAAAAAIELLLDQALQRPEPSEHDCRRYHAAHAQRFAVGERAQLRHVLFAVTPGVDVTALRQRAEACLLDLRCDTRRFAEVAASTSNCPSGARGGDLGWLAATDCAPEFAREIFAKSEIGEIGVLPRLVHTRFGLHVVEVLARQPGQLPAFEAVQSAVAQLLRQQSFATALRQYLQLLAGEARVDGVDLDAATSPLVQ